MSVRDNLLRVQESLNEAAYEAGREASEIELMAVSKTKPLALIKEAYKAGQRLFGENRVLEAKEKALHLENDAKIHLIGHLQSNKIKEALGVFSTIETIDSLKLAKKLNHKLKEAGLQQEVLLQLKTSREESKTGFGSIEELIDCAGYLKEESTFLIRGLMTIPPLSQEERVARTAFAQCRKGFEELKRCYSDLDLKVLSMGMSSDYRWAILEGSTQIRVGTAIFGGRS